MKDCTDILHVWAKGWAKKPYNPTEPPRRSIPPFHPKPPGRPYREILAEAKQRVAESMKALPAPPREPDDGREGYRPVDGAQYGDGIHEYFTTYTDWNLS